MSGERGERFDRVNQREGGSNGRVVEKFTRQGDQTYLPMPFFMTETGLGWYCEGDIPSELHFAGGLSIARQTQGKTLGCDRLFFGSPARLLRRFIELTGEPVLPPDWAFGLWISANGWNCDREVDAQLAALKAHDYPADVMVLEAWSDEQTFYAGTGTEAGRTPPQPCAVSGRAGCTWCCGRSPSSNMNGTARPARPFKRMNARPSQRGTA